MARITLAWRITETALRKQNKPIRRGGGKPPPKPLNKIRAKMTKNLLAKVLNKQESLTEYELKKVLEALFHAERNAHPINRREWKRLSVVVESKLGK